MFSNHEMLWPEKLIIPTSTFGNFNPFKSNIILTIATAKRFDPVPVSQPLLIVLLRFKDARSYLDALIGHKICSFKCTK